MLVLRALALGDLLCAVPFFRALRGRFPRARITLLGLPWAETFVARYAHYLDAFQRFPGWPGIPEVPFDAGATLTFLDRRRAWAPDLAIQLQGSGAQSNAFVALLGARSTAGFVPPGRPAPVGLFVPYPGQLPEVRRHLVLAEALGARHSDPRLEWPVSDADRRELARVVARWGDGLDLGRPYAVVHPGASTENRRWPAERFGAFVRALAGRGLGVVLTGTAAEGELTAAVAGAGGGQLIDLTGRTSLGALAALLERASLVISNDTGISHLADALDRPSVVLFLASDPARWAPLDGDRHLALVAPDLGDRCARAGTPDHPDCRVAGCLALGAEPAPSTRSIEVEVVLAAVDRLLVSAPPVR